MLSTSPENSQSRPYRLLIKLILIVGTWEALIMIVLGEIQLSNPWLETIIDTCLLSIFSGISLWFFILRPEQKRMADRFQSPLYFLEQNVAAIDQIAIVSITDTRGKIIYVNKKFIQISGYSREELLGQDHRLLNSGYHPQEFFAQMWSQIQAGRTWQGIVRNRGKRGNLYWVNAFVLPIFNNKNEISHFISYRFDITDKVIAEAALEQEKLKSIRMHRLSSLGEMAGGMAHEINNPLAIIMGNTGLLNRYLKATNAGPDGTAMERNIQKINAQVERISNIIQNLRDLSQSGENQPVEITSAEQVVQPVLGLCVTRMENLKIQLRLKIDHVEFAGRPVQLQQVLINLLNNSIDAVQRSNEKWIDLVASRENDEIVFRVTDSGPPIPNEIADELMEPFFSTKEIGQGLGLGLSVARQIVLNHGGSLEYDPQNARTSFTIRLPGLAESDFCAPAGQTLDKRRTS